MSPAPVSHGEMERRFMGEIRMDPSGDRKLRGYAIVFHRLSLDLGGFKERIMPEAVDRTLREAHDVRALVDHDSSKIIGRTRAGTLRLMADGHGLSVEIDPPRTSAARDIMESVERGDVSGMSFAFRVPKGGDDVIEENGQLIREVHDMLVREVSIVSFPAYPDTDVALRSIQAFQSTQKGRRSKEYWQRFHRQRLAG